ncbi:septation protein SepH [Arthrobacter crystallopoietes]|uniref:DUF3071 domain-containing protein n=1 Tax=Crystallibacter crystallopoietes TaxID=37928 RepID=A0A1H1GVL6_9MICC|nr:septation protein SepH [Arthrobacter crystallopoietes]AUI52331.1 hypothetical protein AC20117_17585 [Arthrobacter crystallopoietes]SDR17201.1 Protein of unknown function [Arthrobacter crystallopoietes]
MQDLRLVGVHEDGEHLLLSGDGGESYRLAIDEALRSAAARPSVRVPAADSENGGAAMSPREIQARIRAGASAEQVAAESGLDMARILRYEGPVRAERDYMVQQAQRVEVASALPSHDSYRSAFGDAPATLGEMVAHRVNAFGIDAASLEWDSWRRQDGAWEIVARFQPPAVASGSIGEEPPAKWLYSPTSKTVQNSNRWAQQLSELEPLDGPVPARRLTAVADRVFDFEADTAADPETDSTPGDEDTTDSDNLLEVLRSRRGQRLGVDEEADDALALLLTQGGIPAAHPRDGILAGDDTDADGSGGRPSSPFTLSLASSDHMADSSLDLHPGVSMETREITVSGAPLPEENAEAAPDADSVSASADQDQSSEPTDSAEAVASADAAAAEEQQRKRSMKPKRSSVPSWDEIVFGTKHE